jgi:cytochrome c oxidase subunit 2
MVLPLAGCAGRLSALEPVGPAAGSIATLWWIMFAAAIALFALVLTLLGLAYWRPSAISRFRPRHWIVGLGLVMPGVLLTLLVYGVLIQGEMLLPRPAEPQPMRIAATAQQWHWTFEYPDIPGAPATTNELHLPAGQPVDVVVTSLDVIHSFWVPRLGGKIDAIPGHRNVIRLQADEPGSFGGVCAEFCGTDHASMHFQVQAHPSADFASMLGGAP